MILSLVILFPEKIISLMITKEACPLESGGADESHSVMGKAENQIVVKSNIENIRILNVQIIHQGIIPVFYVFYRTFVLGKSFFDDVIVTIECLNDRFYIRSVYL